ncbi:hypothetical protein [Glycomyces dulcitolivorans]|uniref:hypothetical protein n=1 Tax=Glycomyces dulcitolivorans TaxID=2200759 RepID=UPI001300ADE0|nr:hypothetical protein [Glycomyces dulcitolivorans]
MPTEPPPHTRGARRETPVPTVPGDPFVWRGEDMVVVSAVGSLSRGQRWVFQVKADGRVPVATIRDGEITPTGYEPLDSEDLADLQAAVKKTLDAKPRWVDQLAAR